MQRERLGLMALVLLASGCSGSAPGSLDESVVRAAEALLSYKASPERQFVTDGNVQALAKVGNALFLGGQEIDVIGQRSGSAVTVSKASGKRIKGHPELQGVATQAICDDGRGGFYIGGAFRRADSTSVRGLVHILPNGTLDTAYKFSVSGTVWALTRSGNRLYLAGQFTQVAGKARVNVAAIDLKASGSGGALAAWAPAVQGFRARHIAVNFDAVLVSGFIDSVGGTAVPGFAALDLASGALLARVPQSTLRLSSPAVAGATAYVIATSTLNEPTATIKAFSTTTGAFLPFALAEDMPLSNKLWVVGNTLYLATYSDFRAYDATTGARRWTASLQSGSVATLAMDGTRLLVGGFFTAISGAERRYIAALDPTTGAVLDWAPQPNSFVYAIAAGSSSIYIGGEFITIEGSTRGNLAALDVTTGRALNWKPRIKRGPFDQSRPVSALAASGNILYAGGNFAEIATPGGGSDERPALAAIDATTGDVTDWVPALASICTISSLQATPERLFVAGFNLNGSGESLTALNTASGAVLPAFSHSFSGGGGGGSPRAKALLLGSQTLYVGGAFEAIDGVQRAALGAFDANTGVLLDFSPLPRNPEPISNVPLLAQNSTRLFFASQDTTNRWAIGAIDKATGSLISDFAPGFVSTDVSALAATDDALYVGFELQTKEGWYTVNVLSPITGNAINHFAPVFNAGGGGTSRYVGALLPIDDALYVGGLFRTAEDYDVGGIARFGRSALSE